MFVLGATILFAPCLSVPEAPFFKVMGTSEKMSTGEDMPEGADMDTDKALAPVRREMALVPIADATINEARVRSGFWRKLRRVTGRIPFADDLVAAYYCATDARTPRRVRAILFAGLAYFVIPTDVIPDFIAAFGFTDDASVLMAVITAVSGHIKDRHREAARRALLIEKEDKDQ
jgi:uncharacterized membrane protein YkvA (DUF1232 family)